MKKLKATNDDEIEICPASSCYRSLMRDATGAEMDKHDIGETAAGRHEVKQGIEVRYLRDRSSHTVQYEIHRRTQLEPLDAKLTVVSKKK